MADQEEPRPEPTHHHPAPNKMTEDDEKKLRREEEEGAAPSARYGYPVFTVVTRNPNRRVSFSYDHFSAIVSYRNQAITPPVVLPPLFHETKSTVALSPVLGGITVPVAAEVVNQLVMEEDYNGVVGLRLVLTGRMRYKAGAIKSRRYGVYVRCDLLVGLKRGFVGQLPLLGSPACRVDV
ncbi:hypothetical protein DH2020_022997 [Rehmannia glutinosa]|uniref:Late embryogenesis abundant protein LEA-2 subgroup domain-containing protein n=1 Tax=Rehmannia glutinosa TaxID=99300 RepID=A0ABR0W8J4_REHGL